MTTTSRTIKRLFPSLALILLLPVGANAQGIGLGFYNAFDGGQGLTLGTGIGLGFGPMLIIQVNGHYIDLGQFTVDADIATRPWVQTKVFRVELPAVIKAKIGGYQISLLGGGVAFLPLALKLLPGNIDRDLRDDLGYDLLNAELDADPSLALGAMLGGRLSLKLSGLRITFSAKAYAARSSLALTGTYAYANSDGTYSTGNSYDEKLPMRFNGLEVGIGVGK